MSGKHDMGCICLQHASPGSEHPIDKQVCTGWFKALAASEKSILYLLHQIFQGW